MFKSLRLSALPTSFMSLSVTCYLLYYTVIYLFVIKLNGNNKSHKFLFCIDFSLITSVRTF